MMRALCAHPDLNPNLMPTAVKFMSLSTTSYYVHPVTLSPPFTDRLGPDAELPSAVEDGGRNQEYFDASTSRDIQVSQGIHAGS